jgi:hypothetical protein
MRTINSLKYNIYGESLEQQRQAGRYNPASVILYKRKEYTIGSGTTDHIHVFREDEFLIVLSINYHMGYAGIEAFDTTSDKSAELFYQDSQDLNEYVGKNWDELSEITLAKRMMNILYELEWDTLK